MGHTAVTDQAVAPTCTDTGLTEGSHCGVCNTVLVAQTTVSAKGHTWQDATCTTPKTCSICGATEGGPQHSWTAATCTTPKTCSICGATEGGALGHTAVTDQAVAPTCTATGLTEGSHCGVCNTVLVAQTTVSAKGHSWISATCTAPETCSACGDAQGVPLAHYDDDGDLKCDSNCGTTILNGVPVKAPEIVVEGNVSVWDKVTYVEPTQVAEDGYVLITSAEEFAWFLQNTVSGNATNYRLTTNLDMGSKIFTASATRVLEGVLDGDGYVVSNLRHGMQGYSGSGCLFNAISGTIKDITFQNLMVSSVIGTATFTERLTGGTISNVYFDYQVASGRSIGVSTYMEVGENGVQPFIENCIVAGSLNYTTPSSGCYGGAFACYLNAGTISNCTNYANIKKSIASDTGGIAGTVSSNTASIINCINFGNISNTSTGAVGGILGSTTKPLTITGCINYGDIDTIDAAGGIIGNVGAISSSASTLVMDDCYNYGHITTTGNYAGGILGKYLYSKKITATNCANYGDVIADQYAGGFVGKNNGSGAGYSNGFINFLNSANYGNVTVTTAYAGGAFGELGSGYYNAGYLVQGCVIICDVSAPTYAGGFIGYHNVSRTKDKITIITIQDVYSKVNVFATAEGGYGAFLVGLSTNKLEDAITFSITDSKLCIAVAENGVVVENPATVYSYGTDGNSVLANYDTIYSDVLAEVAIFTDGTVFQKMNAYAVFHGHKQWTTTDAPYYIRHWKEGDDPLKEFVTVEVLDENGNEVLYYVEDREIAAYLVDYNGENHTFTIVLMNGDGVIIKTLDTITVKNVEDGVNKQYEIDETDIHYGTSREIGIHVFPQEASFDILPEAIEGIAYNGSAQALVTPGTSACGTVLYRVNGGSFSAEIPVGTEAGTYNIEFIIEPSENYMFTMEGAYWLEVTIAPVYTREDNYIYFGEYPQTIKAEGVTITTTQDNRGYFLGSDGAYYACVVADPYNPSYTFSNDAAVTAGTTYYFKVEPIRWRILSETNGTALILCDSIIANKAFDSSSNNYAESDIRAWLNDQFYNTAFTDMQRDIILLTRVDNSAESTGSSSNPYACENTEDKVFLLSYTEATNGEYGFSTTSSIFESDTMKQMFANDYAKATGTCLSTTDSSFGKGVWWLRSSYEGREGYSLTVQPSGGNVYQLYVYHEYTGVVPALQIRL